MKASPIATGALRELVEAGAIERARLVGEGRGFALSVHYGTTERVLQAKRGHVRQFKNLERAAGFLRALGFSRVEVELSAWKPRPQRSTSSR